MAEAPNSPVEFRYDRTLKDPTVEESINLHFHRRLAFALVLWPLRNRPYAVTPNQITMASGTIGVVAAGAYFLAPSHGPLWWFVGSFLLLASVVLDCADGMLARLTGRGSELGMLLDGLVDFVVGFFVWLAVASYSASVWPHPLGWPIAIAIFVSIVSHAAVYDQVKNQFVEFVRPRDTKASIAPPSAAEPKGPILKFARWYYRNVYESVGRANAVVLPEHVTHEDARKALTPAMRRATYLGLGTSLACFYLSALFIPMIPTASMWTGLVGIVLVLNSWTVFVLVTWRSALRELAGRKP